MTLSFIVKYFNLALSTYLLGEHGPKERSLDSALLGQAAVSVGPIFSGYPESSLGTDYLPTAMSPVPGGRSRARDNVSRVHISLSLPLPLSTSLPLLLSARSFSLSLSLSLFLTPGESDQGFHEQSTKNERPRHDGGGDDDVPL